MLDQYSRWIYFFDVAFRKYPPEAPDMSLEETLAALQNRVNAGRAVKLANRGTAAYRIRDMKIEDGFVSFLFQYSDSRVTDPAFAKLTTTDLRTEPKLEGEGVAASAHLVMNLVPVRVGTHVAVLEHIPGIPASGIAWFLNSQIKSLRRFTFPGAGGRPKDCHLTLEMTGHTSQSLEDDLNTGELRDIELVRPRVVNSDFDENAYVVEMSRSIKLRPSRTLRGGGAMQTLNLLARRGHDRDFSDLRIRVKTDEGQERTVDVDIRQLDANNGIAAHYTRHEHIHLETAMPQCVDGFESGAGEEVRQGMLAVLRDEIADE